MMLWIKLGWRNLWRNKRRSVIELLSIGGAIFLGVAWNNLAIGSYDKFIDDGVRMASGHIGVYHSDYLEMRKTDQVIDAVELVKELEQAPGVKGVYPRLQVPGLIRSSRESRSTGLVGLEFEREKEQNPLLNPKLIVEGSLPGPDEKNRALIGYRLAEELDIEIGKKFVIMAQESDGQIASSLMRVAGIIKTNARDIDASMVIMDREYLAGVIGYKNKCHEIAVMLKDYHQSERMLPRIQKIVSGFSPAEAFTWREAMPELASGIDMDYGSFKVMMFILYIIVGIGTINTLLMSVMERSREFGVIRAIGVNKSGIRKMVLAEAFVLACTGIVLGIILSTLVGLYTSNHGIDFSGMMEDHGYAGIIYEPVMFSRFDIKGSIVLCGGMLVIALLASLYPTHYIMKTRPSNAMRKY